MLRFLKKYWRYIFLVCCVIIVGILGIIFYDCNENNEISSESEIKLSVLNEEKAEKKDTKKTVFVDVKGAVNAPGVYEIDSEKRIIDAINLAGGLTDKADTINLNLSKKVTDEMYIIVYTKTEIYNYKQNNNSNNISCASVECVCPDSNNNACVNEGNSKSKQEVKKENGKISINTASKEELMNISGIGESKANAIIEYRNENGLFNSLEDIKNVSGIGNALYEKIKNSISL